MNNTGLIDDFSSGDRASNGNRWSVVSDRVMGGVSRGGATCECLDGRPALRLRGEVSLENNGGFLQLALDLAPAGDILDAAAWAGISVTVRGNGGPCALSLRTSELRRPWQSYRASLCTLPQWQVQRVRFDDFLAHRTELPLNPGKLRRLGLIAVGAAGRVDFAVGHLEFF